MHPLICVLRCPGSPCVACTLTRFIFSEWNPVYVWQVQGSVCSTLQQRTSHAVLWGTFDPKSTYPWLNPFTPESDQFQISPEKTSSILFKISHAQVNVVDSWFLKPLKPFIMQSLTKQKPPRRHVSMKAVTDRLTLQWFFISTRLCKATLHDIHDTRASPAVV